MLWLLDPHHAILLLVELSCALVVGRVMLRCRRLRTDRELRDALLTALFVGVAAGVSYLLWPRACGYFGGGIWVSFLLGPALMLRAANRLAVGRRLGAATVLVRLAASLRPLAGWQSLAGYYGGLARWARGDRETGLRMWQALEEGGGGFAAIIAVERLAAEGRWGEAAERIEQETGRYPELLPSLLPRRTRALGELGRLDSMVELLGGYGAVLRAAPALLAQCLLPAFAFLGRVERVTELLDGPFRALDRASRAAWLGTAELAAGHSSAGRANLVRARQTADFLQRAAIERRLAHPPTIGDPPLGPGARRALAELEIEWAAAHRVLPACLPRRTPWVTWSLAASLLAAFLLEAASGGSTRQDTLLGLGALDPNLVRQGDWWRVLAAQWLHYGPVHLGFNLVGLALLGERVERALGWLRTATVYVGAGTLAMLAHTLLVVSGLVPPAVLVGASGGVMGLAGAAGAILLGGWRQHGLVAARTELRFIVLLVVAQAVFDLSLPGSSFIGHAFGAAAGFGLAGLMVELGWRLWVVVTAPALALSIGGEQTASRLPWRKAPCGTGEVAQCAASCELGVLESCAALGFKYSTGVDVVRDFGRARALLARACGGGVAVGCADLGVMHDQGEGGPPDHTRAYELYQAACQGGSAFGCRNLAISLLRGEGVSPDRERARHLLERACRRGDEKSCDLVRRTR